MARNKLYPVSVTPGIPKLGTKPDGWIETTYGDVLGVVKRPAKINDAEQYRLVTAKRSRGGIVPREVLAGKQILTKVQYYIHKDDFIISKRQIIHGACGVVPEALERAIVSGEYSVLRVKDGLLLSYLNYFTHTVYFQQTCFQASVGVDVEKMIFDLNEWLRYKVNLPPLDEQRKIAKILSTWDKAIELTGQLIAAKQRLKKGLMQQLLLGKVRFENSGFQHAISQDEGKNKPIGWTVFEFEQFAAKENKKYNPQTGTIPYRCIELEHLSQETGKILGYVPISGQRSIKNCFSAGQVLFGKLRPYLRKYAQPDFDGVCSSEIWILSGKKGICTNGFLFYLVQTHYFTRLANVTSGTKMPRSDWDIVSKAAFAIPSIPEQNRIVVFLRSFDIEIDLLIQKLAALQQQKKGLMQQLLTGKIRVKGVSEVQGTADKLRPLEAPGT